MSVTRRGRFDYVGDDPNEVAVMQMIEMFDEYGAQMIRNARTPFMGEALIAAGLPNIAAALGLTTGQDMDKERT